MTAHAQIAPSLELKSRGFIASRDELVDAAFVAATVLLGLVGFRTAYGGIEYLIVGAIGVGLGIVIAHLSIRLNLPLIATSAVAAVVFFGLGGALALRDTATGATPTLGTLRTLGGTSIHGWAQLLTILPPVGSTGPLLVLPYLLGLVAATCAYLVARRTALLPLQLLVPIAVLTLSILFGTPKPASLVMQGSLFSAVGLAWLAFRQRRTHATVALGITRRHRRMATAAAMLALATVSGTAVAPHLPWAGGKRIVLRNYVQPPFDPSAYPSPLAAFRNYVTPTGLRKLTLLTVHGLPKGQPLRFAVMDAYDGLAWGVSNGAPDTAGAFQRIGRSVPTDTAGKQVPVTVNVGAYSGVWLPDAGEVHSITFTGADSASLQSGLRYSVATGAAVISQGLSRDDSYTLDVVVPPSPSRAQLAGAVTAGQPSALVSVPQAVPGRAKQWAGTGPSAIAMLDELARHLRQGRYSDGTSAHSPSLPGHGEARLQQFLTGSQLVGDDEQYAAAFALLANSLGFPTRVVLGAFPEADGVVKGRDVHAWDEVDLAGVGWVRFSVTPATNRQPEKRPPTVVTPNRAPNRVPPPLATTPPSVRSSADTSKATSRRKRHKKQQPLISGLQTVIRAAEIVGSPLAVIVLILLSIIGAKAVRRRRRRLRGLPVQRVSAGWLELVSTAVDLGIPRPYAGTRRSVASQLALPQLAPLAAAADTANFGPEWPNSRTAADYWRNVEAARRSLLDGASRGRRMRAAFRLSSFRGFRPSVPDQSA